MNVVTQSKEMLGSVIEIKLLEKDQQHFEACFSELKRIEQTYSRFLDTSLIGMLNANLNKWHFVPDELLHIVNTALDIQEKTNNNFDITIKSTMDTLGYDKQYSFTPKAEQQPTKVQKITDMFTSPIELDLKKKRIFMRKQIDFGGCGKGYALDAVATLLNHLAVTHYYINAGGDIFAKRDPAQQAWTILLEHPDDANKALGKIILDNKAIAASAPNRRRWAGGKMHHLINTKTKQPANSVKAIFILADTGIYADGYATGLFTAGFEAACKMSLLLPIEVLIISAENKMFESDGFNIEYL